MNKIYRDDVIRIARAELGYLEKQSDAQLDDKTANAGSNNYTKYARDLWACTPHFYQGPKQPAEWCCMFFDWCLLQAAKGDAEAAQKALCYTGPYGAGCGMSVTYYKEAGRWFERGKGTPKPGDQIFFGASGNVRHTGLVVEVSASAVKTIEGNAGNKVQERTYALNNSDIYGYGRPRYDGDEAPVEQLPFVDVPEGKFYTKHIQWAYQNGLTAGKDATHFKPNDVCTRGEMVTFLHRLYDLLKK